MRVLQLIDSLRPGGAERMSVNIANALLGKVEASFLCCTREEGFLKEELKAEVIYFFAQKKSNLDFMAFYRLRNFVKKEDIDLIHAHGTSWFWGVLLKISGVEVKLVWHDHYGESATQKTINSKFLKLGSYFFNGINSVNSASLFWVTTFLHCKKVIQLNNFVAPKMLERSGTILKGDRKDFRVICISNLREQKDIHNLLNAFELLVKKCISLHLIGSNNGSIYANSIIKRIESLPKVYYYGEQSNICELIEQANLGVLSSRTEGLPLVILEYGICKVPVVCTRVGDCEEVIGDTGILVEPKDHFQLASGIQYYYDNPRRREQDSKDFNQRINTKFSEDSVIKKLLEFYERLF